MPVIPAKAGIQRIVAKPVPDRLRDMIYANLLRTYKKFSHPCKFSSKSQPNFLKFPAASCGESARFCGSNVSDIGIVVKEDKLRGRLRFANRPLIWLLVDAYYSAVNLKFTALASSLGKTTTDAPVRSVSDTLLPLTASASYQANP